ncbi:MAG: type II toxin-antitoxin system HicA family toxin [Dehalococcoidia bacterium]|jgi:predicted RNA binding protein YcfA (HicA-like mRNA interferase family)|nr:MAG: type II toxin-antitoxin system HicA family toxin [Dehalococcoidia bacterium]
MPGLPVLSGRKLVQILAKAGFTPARQKGSHIILVKTDESGKHAVVVPDHKEIDRGTLLEIIRQAGLKKPEFLKLVK